MVKLSTALCHIHDLGVTHGDLKPENVLMSEHCSKAATLKLTDFEHAFKQPPAFMVQHAQRMATATNNDTTTTSAASSESSGNEEGR